MSDGTGNNKQQGMEPLFNKNKRTFSSRLEFWKRDTMLTLPWIRANVTLHTCTHHMKSARPRCEGAWWGSGGRSRARHLLGVEAFPPLALEVLHERQDVPRLQEVDEAVAHVAPVLAKHTKEDRVMHNQCDVKARRERSIAGAVEGPVCGSRLPTHPP
jgi:hypothetical protein